MTVGMWETYCRITNLLALQKADSCKDSEIKKYHSQNSSTGSKNQLDV
jgi:hypothetical protein